MVREATESSEHNRWEFENSKLFGRELDATDKCGTVSDGMSKPVRVYLCDGCINWDDESKNIDSYL